MGMGSLAAAAARRAAIMEQVGKLRDKISVAREVKTDLSNSDKAINDALKQWTNRYNAFQASSMSEVVVTDKFEGESAEKIQTRLPDGIQKMTETQSSANSVQDEISKQQTKLDEYITRLEQKISMLLSELASVV